MLRRPLGVRAMVLAVLVIPLAVTAAVAQTESFRAQHDRVIALNKAGKYAEALPVAEQFVAEAFLASRRSDSREDKLWHAESLNDLGDVFFRLKRYPEAIQSYTQSLATFENIQGPQHEDVAYILKDLGRAYERQSRCAEAVPYYARALTIFEKTKGPKHIDLAGVLRELAKLQVCLGLYDEAEKFFLRVRSIRESKLGANSLEVASDLIDLGDLYRRQGRSAHAEALFVRALAVREKALGPNHLDVAHSLNHLALLYSNMARYDEAEPLFKRSIAVNEKTGGPNTAALGMAFGNLAELYREQRRYHEAEPLYRRAIEINERTSGPESVSLAYALNNFALLQQTLGRAEEAEQLLKRALSICEKVLGAHHPTSGSMVGNLAQLYGRQRRYTDAEPLFQRSLQIAEKAYGPQHRKVAIDLNNLANLYGKQGRYGDAETLYKRSLGILEAALGDEHPFVAQALFNIADLYFVQSKWVEAFDFYERGAIISVQRTLRSGETVGKVLTGNTGNDTERTGYAFPGLIKAANELAAVDKQRASTLAATTFLAAQWARLSDTAGSVSQMAARQAKGDSNLARLVRERQDLVTEWKARDQLMIAARTQSSVTRDMEAEHSLTERLATIDARVKEIDQTLAKDFPEYSTLTSRGALSLINAKELLQDDEVLVLFFDTPAMRPTQEEMFVWVLHKEKGVWWTRTSPGTKGLADEVDALRCGLDATAWRGDRALRCYDLLKTAYTTEDAALGKPLPFDVNRAHELYKSLFGPIEELIAGKHLLVVPSGSLATLPLSVLVTKPPVPPGWAEATGRAPTAADFAHCWLPGSEKKCHREAISWLGAKQPITILPSVSSLEALRKFAKPSKAEEAFIGFGDPVLTGTPECAKLDVPATCPEVTVADASANQRRVVRSAGSTFTSLTGVFRGRLADVNAVKSLCPLPDTAQELRCVAKGLGAQDTQVYIGARATETEVKATALDKFRIMHFATHGLLAGQAEEIAKSDAEPALVLTPPATPTEADDGLLTASEISQLRLDADWVILSACNTAGPAGGGQDKNGIAGSETLSGLARAFFYAGARALLVSHWEVFSDAAVKITTRAFAEIKADSSIGRSEAMRRSMIALTESSTPFEAHPAFWAPFVVVGEGGV